MSEETNIDGPALGLQATPTTPGMGNGPSFGGMAVPSRNGMAGIVQTMKAAEAKLDASRTAPAPGQTMEDAINGALSGQRDGAAETEQENESLDGALDEALAEDTDEREVPASGWTRDDVRLAVSALKRAGVPESVIRATAERSVDALVNWGLGAHEQRAANDDRYRRSNGKDRNDDAIGGTAEPTPAPAYTYRLPDEVRESLDEKASTALEKSLQDALSAIAGKADVGARSAEETALRVAAQSLQSQYPELQTAKGMRTVREGMEYLAGRNPGRFETYKDLMLEAARREFGRRAAKAAPQDPARARELTMRRAGQVNVTSRNGGSPRKMSSDDLIDYAIAQHDKGVQGDALRADVARMQPFVDSSKRRALPSHLRL